MIDMLPREYWLQIYRELLPIVPELLEEERQEIAKIEAQEAKRILDIRRRYDAVIRAKIKANNNCVRKPPTDHRREQLREAQRRYRAKMEFATDKYEENEQQ